MMSDFCDDFRKGIDSYERCELRDEILERLGIPFPLSFDNKKYVEWIENQSKMLEDYKKQSGVECGE